jgi:hypothetical protein
MDVSKKKQAFKRLAESRTKKAISAMNLITNLSNTSNYYYEEEDIKKIVDALRESVKLVEATFQKPLSKKRDFEL